jgi:aminopeptidase N
MIKNVLFTAFAALALAACTDPAEPGNPAPADSIARADGPVLTMDYASARAGQVRDVRYAITVTLDPELDHFAGENRMRFDWAANPAGLTIDFGGGEVDSLSVNGKPATVDYRGYFIAIPASLLEDGENEIVVRYRHPWSTTGAGLYRYDDPDDGRTYLYTDFEPCRSTPTRRSRCSTSRTSRPGSPSRSTRPQTGRSSRPAARRP